MTSNHEELLDKTFHCCLFASHGRIQHSRAVPYFPFSFSSSSTRSSIASALATAIIPHTFYCTTFHKYCLQYLLHYLQKFGGWVHTNIFRRMQRNILRCMRLKKLHSGHKPLKSESVHHFSMHTF